MVQDGCSWLAQYGQLSIRLIQDSVLFLHVFFFLRVPNLPYDVNYFIFNVRDY